jgi:hypothetical protein
MQAGSPVLLPPAGGIQPILHAKKQIREFGNALPVMPGNFQRGMLKAGQAEN